MNTFSADINFELSNNPSNITSYLLRLDFLKRKSEYFGKLEEVFVLDLDDTLYNREEQLKNETLARNRGKKGNEVIQKELGGYDKFVDDYYFTGGITQELMGIVKEKSSIILTAGEFELQMKKLRKIGLDKISNIIVDNSKEKPLALFKYILNKFERLPERVVVYDDRVNFLLEKGQTLANLLGIEIEINEVKLKANQIDEINKNVFIPQKIEHTDMMLALYSLID